MCVSYTFQILQYNAFFKTAQRTISILTGYLFRITMGSYGIPLIPVVLNTLLNFFSRGALRIEESAVRRCKGVPSLGGRGRLSGEV